MLPVNRLVALLTPVFTVAAAAVSHLALTRFGFHLSPDALVGVETTVAASAAGVALKWLHGHQRYEALVKEAVSVPDPGADLSGIPVTDPATVPPDGKDSAEVPFATAEPPVTAPPPAP